MWELQLRTRLEEASVNSGVYALLSKYLAKIETKNEHALSWNFTLKTVDDTGIEPVTPTMSMWCSTAEPIVRVLRGRYYTSIYRPKSSSTRSISSSPK